MGKTNDLARKDGWLLRLLEHRNFGGTAGSGCIRINDLAVAFGSSDPGALTSGTVYYGIVFKEAPVVLVTAIKAATSVDAVYASAVAQPATDRFTFNKTAGCGLTWVAIGRHESGPSST